MLRPLFLATALLTLGIAGARADDVTTRVSYSDLDLSRPADAKVLAARLQDAATAVCLKANPENVVKAALENCINISVHMAMSRMESDMDATVRDRLSNVRTAMREP
ncbi:MAG TPA: UrcA family protein [Rhizomicrobium sp.]|jgi:UrcA family protein|nr:UrcA family protein [Rhizomicrobium sp.]